MFIRCDDAGALTPALTGFAAIFAERALPVSYQVIPAQLTDECADWARSHKRASPVLFEFGQHGHTHEMEVRGRREYYEFGPERDLAAQSAVIAAGRRIMIDKLGDAAEQRLFTPPRHRYDRNTLRALADNGFGIISASSYATRRHRAANWMGRQLGLTNIGRGGVSYHGRARPEAPLLELSVSVGVDDGPPVDRDLDTLMGEIAIARQTTAQVGLMLHHAAWATDAKRDWLKCFADRLVQLPDAHFAILGAIADDLS